MTVYPPCSGNHRASNKAWIDCDRAFAHVASVENRLSEVLGTQLTQLRLGVTLGCFGNCLDLPKDSGGWMRVPEWRLVCEHDRNLRLGKISDCE